MADDIDENKRQCHIDFSGDFGGRDASAAMVPHWRTLKYVTKDFMFDGFPLPELHFILRVDGAIQRFEPSTARHVRIDRKGSYVSVDIGITRDDLNPNATTPLSTVIARAIVASGALLRGMNSKRLATTDWEALDSALRAFATAYEGVWATGSALKRPS